MPSTRAARDGVRLGILVFAALLLFFAVAGSARAHHGLPHYPHPPHHNHPPLAEPTPPPPQPPPPARAAAWDRGAQAPACREPCAARLDDRRRHGRCRWQGWRQGGWRLEGRSSAPAGGDRRACPNASGAQGASEEEGRGQGGEGGSDSRGGAGRTRPGGIESRALGVADRLLAPHEVHLDAEHLAESGLLAFLLVALLYLPVMIFNKATEKNHATISAWFVRPRAWLAAFTAWIPFSGHPLGTLAGGVVASTALFALIEPKFPTEDGSLEYLIGMLLGFTLVSTAFFATWRWVIHRLEPESEGHWRIYPPTSCSPRSSSCLPASPTSSRAWCSEQSPNTNRPRGSACGPPESGLPVPIAP